MTCHTRRIAVDTREIPATAAEMAVENADVPATAAEIEDENATAADSNNEILSQIIQGYSSDPWFDSASNTAQLEIYQGFYYRGDALVVPKAHHLARTA